MDASLRNLLDDVLDWLAVAQRRSQQLDQAMATCAGWDVCPIRDDAVARGTDHFGYPVRQRYSHGSHHGRLRAGCNGVKCVDTTGSGQRQLLGQLNDVGHVGVSDLCPCRAEIDVWCCVSI